MVCNLHRPEREPPDSEPTIASLGIIDVRARGLAADFAARGLGTVRAFRVDASWHLSGIAVSLSALVASFLVPLAIALLVR
ncbi:LrgB family protein [Bradyrhizobium oligotrophicum]